MFTIDRAAGVGRCWLILPMVSLVFIVAGPAHPPAVPGGAGAVQHGLRARAGELLGHPGGQGIRAGGRRRSTPSARSTASTCVRALRLARTSGALWPAMTFILGMASAAVLWQGGLAVVAGRITLGQLVQFFGYLMMLSWPMIALGWTTNLIQQGMASMRRLDEIFERTPGHRRSTGRGGARPAARRDRVSKRLVRLRRRSRCCATSRLKIPAGATVAIVGPTGSGKTTLISLHPPSVRRERRRGADRWRSTSRALSLDTLRGSIGFVPQEPFLFSDTLEENLASGVEAGDGHRVRDAARDRETRRATSATSRSATRRSSASAA